MKLFISGDIEGVAGIADWDETSPGQRLYDYFADEMTKEVSAACEGAMEAGITEIFVKDAHGSGRNINPAGLPEQVKLLRSWTGNPFCMMAGIDSTFNAALMVGYHSARGTNGSPMAHTMNCANNYVKINGLLASEFMINSFTASYFHVPVVFVSGDTMLCESAQKLNEGIHTVPLSEGIGNASVSVSPAVAVRRIKEEVKKSLSRDCSGCLVALPERFEVEIYFREHHRAYKASFYPGAKQIEPCKVSFEARDYLDVLKFIMFVL